MSGPATARPAPHAGLRRGASRVLFLVYLWIAGVFPVLHASAEQPAAQVAVQSSGEAPDGSLPAGHDHLSCHFCSTTAGLATPPAMPVEVLLPVEVTSRAPATPAVESVALAWAHHAIPSRAPPISPA